MADICLSPVLGLRCLGLSHVQEAVTLVPIGLEVIFSLGLVFAGRDAGRIRYLLAAEAPVFLLLAVLSFLSHVVSVFQNNTTPFEALDIAIGVTSFLPILLYTTFIYLFNLREFFPRLPMRFMNVAKAFLLAVIPVIVITNEIGSFIGIQYRRNPDANNPSVYYLLGRLEFARELLSSTSLALMTVAQALTFLLFFLGLTSGLIKQRQIETRAATEREGVLFRGLGWLAIGMKFSMLETAFGWVTPSFGLIFLRRGIRLIGRACIIIGVVKGPESREEFIILDTENGRNFHSGTRKLRVSGLRLHISSPTLVETTMSYRLSRMTFLRPFTRSGHDPEPIPSTSRHTSILPPSPFSFSARTPRTTKTRPPPLVIRPTSDESHVTVVQSLGRAPTLVLRLSSTVLPTGDAMAAMSEHIQSGPVSAVLPPPRPDAAPLTEPLPRISIRPPEDHAGVDKGRPSSDVAMLHRKPKTSSETQHIRGLSRSVPSSPRGPHTFIPPFPAALPSEAPAHEDGTHTLRSTSTRSGADSNARDTSTASGLTTSWISTEDIPRESRESYVNIKTVDSGRPHVTLTPTRDVRTNIVLERLGDVVGPSAYSSPPTPELGGGLVRKDSGVLGKDDLVRMRRARSVF